MGRSIPEYELPGAAVQLPVESQILVGTMAKFRVRVSTGEACGAGTWDKVSVSIVGTKGESPLLPLDHLGKEFTAGAVSARESGQG